MRRFAAAVVVFFLLVVPTTVRSQDTDDPAVTAIEKAQESTDHQLDVLAKRIDDILWYERVGY
ncbi:MAG: hypothetical protein QNL88_16350, partial [Acidobacteriota bacterium]|nr:hypothetical protein [Acidobacteriota bacterium]